MIIVFLFVLIGCYLGHIKDNIDIKNDNEIKQRITLLETFFEIPKYNSRFSVNHRNKGVLIITEFIKKNKVYIFKEYFSEKFKKTSILEESK
jgi:hypothetical protein